MWRPSACLLAALLVHTARAYHYDPQFVDWNLNENPYASSPIEYWGQWSGHDYTPSPDNWRFPFYTIMPDRFVNGDPFNDNVNGTYFEHDTSSNQMRHGGDVVGLQNTLDYIQGIGVKGLYLAGSPFLNIAWGYDQYSPIDLSLLDWHLGTIEQWRDLIDDIHARGMYVILDNTFATLGDLVGFDHYLNTTAPFLTTEHKVRYKSGRQYWDFALGNDYNATCSYPPFWNETGFPVESYVTDSLVGCYNSDFDQYGDTEAFGVFADWRRELSKFASTQDRVREWYPPVRAKLENFYCMAIAQLDVDGFRYDKATQSTVDAMGSMNNALRQCARRFGKTNFFVPGEITGGNDFGSIFIGRGRQPDMLPTTINDAVHLTNTSSGHYFLREAENAALDSAAFHYTVYRTLTRFLGMDGNLAAGYDAPLNWVDMWNTFLVTNDLVNAETGAFDPRHMYGVTNQDVFRWPAISNGAQRQLLGHFVTTLLMPGIPLLLWGEEQAFYILDNTADNYIFGRQPMSSQTAWQDHGCYNLGSAQYYQWPIDASRYGCADDSVSYDHRDPSAPIRNVLRHMFNLRETYPVLNDGFYLQQLSNMTEEIYYPGSSGVPTETGFWSVMRSTFAVVPGFTPLAPSDSDLNPGSNRTLIDDFSRFANLTGLGNVTRAWNSTINQSDERIESGSAPQERTEFVWLLYSNLNESKTFDFNCSDVGSYLDTHALISPFAAGSVVRNLLSPYDEVTLQNSSTFLGLANSTKANGCLDQIMMPAYGFRAYVPSDEWQSPRPMVTRFSPGHDARILSDAGLGGLQDVNISLEFSVPMNCTSVTHSLSFNVSKMQSLLPQIKQESISCTGLHNSTVPAWPGAIDSVWSWSATLENVPNGILEMITRNASEESGVFSTNSVDHFMLRIGQANNPMVFPRTANYSNSLVTRETDGGVAINHSAEGADLWRYSTNWYTSYSSWMPYAGGSTLIEELRWNGTSEQAWKGVHVRVEYWSQLSGSSDHVQEGDLDFTNIRRYPHLFLLGPFNQYGYDSGPNNAFDLVSDGLWKYYFLTEWPAIAQINVWGINPDGKPDQTYVMGDIDGDSVLDRMPPSALSPPVLNITQPPPKSFTGWTLEIEDSTNRYQVIPAGNATRQMVIYILLWIIPAIGGCISVWIYMKSFYAVKFEKFGLVERGNAPSVKESTLWKAASKIGLNVLEVPGEKSQDVVEPQEQTTGSVRDLNLTAIAQGSNRRKVLIATMEYDIEDWQVKVKIGGLGVMAQLMGKNLGHQDLIWVVPCVGDIDYPVEDIASPMHVKILGKVFKVNVQYHILRNITYVLLDAPTFRQQSKGEPYPARMDDLDSAIYYSAWNQCIAQAIERFQPDLYHINDYHGAVAPLYLLPSTIPVCLSLHNAEFQGLWPMRTPREYEEVSDLFNLPMSAVQQFVQFGEVFNLLHAGASYLRVYQQGFGAVGVSKKYGVRSHLRYPIFWGLKKVGQLPNPDPSDTGEWDKKLPYEKDITVDASFEAGRPELKRQAQEWANLNQDPEAELFVFVGRWSTQKGIDLIADVFPSVLENHEHAQLICVGPVIDLHGKFAAAKLERMMKLYPGRVFSRPVFTALPPYIFSGAEFALIPSRDEPFGLVAVEFGRKGALGVGARVGGLGQMPGWWYTIESMETPHLLEQFRLAIEEAISSEQSTRAMMRARSAKQRFPVAQWTEDLDILQSTAIKVHQKKSYATLDDEETKVEKASRRRLKRRSHHRQTQLPKPEVDGRSLGDMYPSDIEFETPEYDGEGEPALTVDQMYSEDEDDIFEEFDRRWVDAEDVLTQSRSSNVSPTYGAYLTPANEAAKWLTSNHKSILRNDESEVTTAERVMLTVPALSTDIREPIPLRSIATELLGAVDGGRSRTPAESRPSTGTSPGMSLVTSLSQSMDHFANDPNGASTPMLGSPRSIPVAALTRYDPSAPLFGQSQTGSPFAGQSETNSPLIGRSQTHSPFLQQSQTNTGPPTGTSTPNYLSGKNVVGQRKDYKLQQVDPFFTDPTGQYYERFQRKLENLKQNHSDSRMIIGDYLTRSEKTFYGELRDTKLGLRRRPQFSAALSGTTVATLSAFVDEDAKSELENGHVHSTSDIETNTDLLNEVATEKSYARVSTIKKYMQRRIGDWPVYAIFLAFGQIMAANSYQIVVLEGQVGQEAQQLYIICAVYMIATLAWWAVFRWVGSRPVLCAPFFFYGLAFLLVGLAQYASAGSGRSWINHLGLAAYAVASASGGFFFTLNFGDEGGSQVRSWLFRACVIQGTQQIYIALLWLWGSFVNRVAFYDTGLTVRTFSETWYITVVGVVAALFFWSVGFLIFHGLPSYYCQMPGSVPDFYRSVWKRKILAWFLVMVLIQNFFLSPQYGRSWSFLFNSSHVSWWQTALLLMFFFVVVWILAMWSFSVLAASHTWMLPIFAIGLGAPRWAQIWWGTSNMGLWLPWAPGGYVGSALISRALWLWLGILDAIQGVGLGMILLSTLTRVHVLFALATAQVLGAATTAFARAVAPDAVRPAPVFPDLTGTLSGLQNGWFWIGLLLNLGICIGYFKFFRKEQLTKP